jgi:hypothetical protein
MNREMLELLAPVSAPHRTTLELLDRIQELKSSLPSNKFEVICYCEESLFKLADKMDVNKLSQIENIVNELDHKGIQTKKIDKDLILREFELYKAEVMQMWVEDEESLGLDHDEAVESADNQWEEESSAHLSRLESIISKKIGRALDEAESDYLYDLTM